MHILSAVLKILR